jgi:hypothetical protein
MFIFPSLSLSLRTLSSLPHPTHRRPHPYPSLSLSLISRWRCTRLSTPPTSPLQIPSRTRPPHWGPWPPLPPPRTWPPSPLPAVTQSYSDSSPLPSTEHAGQNPEKPLTTGCVGWWKASIWRRWPQIKTAGSAARQRWTGTIAASEVERHTPGVREAGNRPTAVSVSFHALSSRLMLFFSPNHTCFQLDLL